MKSTTLVALAAATIVAAAAGPAQADGNFYLGGSLGSASLDDSFDGFAVDANSTAYRLVAGWQFNDYFALEGGYHNFGRFKQRFDNGGMPVNIGLEADGFTLGLNGTLPLGDRFGLFGRAGYFFWNGNAAINNVTQARPEDANLYLGAGVRFAMTERLSLLADWSGYQLEDTSSDVLSIGLIMNF